MVNRFLAVYGPLQEAEARSVRGAAAAVSAEVLTFDHPAALVAELERRLPFAVLVTFGSDGAVEVLAHLRGNVRYAAVPVLGLCNERSTLAFGELYTQGGDDLVSARTVRPLLARLRPLAERPESATLAPHGSAVVAGSDPAWRTSIGRMLSNSGLVPIYVNNVPDAVDGACAPDTRFVVARDDLPPDGAVKALALSRQRAAGVPWVVVAPSKRAAEVRTLLDLPYVAVVDALAPPDHLLFIANELGRSQLTERRSTPRLLYGAQVAFRVAGAPEDDFGFSYNVSAGGLFVRTLAPPPVGVDAWIEVMAPATERALRLVGRVAWRRAFGPNETATVPPGFGVGLSAGLPGDLEAWAEGCHALTEQPGASPRREAWAQLSQVPPALVASTVM